LERDVKRAAVVAPRVAYPPLDSVEVGDGTRFRHASNALFGAVEQAVGSHLTDDGKAPADFLFAAALTLVTSCWRIAERADAGRLEPEWNDAEPILLLIEHQLRAVEEGTQAVAAMAARQRSWIRDTRAEVERLAGPWLSRIGPRTRARLALLIDVGGAPSPFCQVEPDWHQRIDMSEWVSNIVGIEGGHEAH
jgi:hypothetical protein